MFAGVYILHWNYSSPPIPPPYPGELFNFPKSPESNGLEGEGLGGSIDYRSPPIARVAERFLKIKPNNFLLCGDFIINILDLNNNTTKKFPSPSPPHPPKPRGSLYIWEGLLLRLWWQTFCELSYFVKR